MGASGRMDAVCILYLLLLDRWGSSGAGNFASLWCTHGCLDLRIHCHRYASLAFMAMERQAFRVVHGARNSDNVRRIRTDTHFSKNGESQ
jgi:hypothetical protein